MQASTVKYTVTYFNTLKWQLSHLKGRRPGRRQV
jgi:hypothetical protein